MFMGSFLKRTVRKEALNFRSMMSQRENSLNEAIEVDDSVLIVFTKLEMVRIRI